MTERRPDRRAGTGIAVRAQRGGEHHRADPLGPPCEIDVELADPRLAREAGANRLAHLALGHRFPGDLPQRDGQRHRQRHQPDDDQQALQPGLGRREMAAEPVEPGHDRRGERDGDEVGQEQQQRTAGHGAVQRRDAETHHCERRHERNGDRHAHHRLAAPADQRIAARHRREQGNEQVEQIGLGPRRDLARHRLDRRECDEAGAQHHRDRRAGRQGKGGAADLGQVEGGDAEAEADDRHHQRRDQHRADQHGGGWQQQPEDRDQPRNDDEEGIAPAESGIGLHPREHRAMLDRAHDHAAPPAPGHDVRMRRGGPVHPQRLRALQCDIHPIERRRQADREATGRA